MRVSISASCAVACMCEIRKEADPRRYDEVYGAPFAQKIFCVPQYERRCQICDCHIIMTKKLIPEEKNLCVR